MHDHCIALRSKGPTLPTLSVHYMPKEEAERIARVAPTLGCEVTDGPRAMTQKELEEPQRNTKR